MTAIVELIALPPDRIGASLALLAGFVVACEYLRISLQVVATRSVAIHLAVQLLTVVIQPVVLAVVLVLSIAARPDCAAVSMVYVVLLYFVWYLAGQSTLLLRPDSQGADVGFMTVGAVITFIPGFVAALVF